MLLSCYAQAADPGELVFWLGVFDCEDPPAPGFTIGGKQATPEGAPVLQPIGDRETGPAGRPRNHAGVFRFKGYAADTVYRVVVAVADQTFPLTTRTLPQSLPTTLGGGFNLLLCSCYYQPEDKSGLLGDIVSAIGMQPHLTVLAGDQVYLDLPLTENLPIDAAGMAQKLGGKYRRNFVAATPAHDAGGLSPVLARAPVVCIPDDHEFWNNYPYRQTQLPDTWSFGDAVRERWASTALALYQDYQLYKGPGPTGARRLDIAPLKMLFIDMRTLRDNAGHQLMSGDAIAALAQWKDELIADRSAGRPAVGVLSSGQILFIDPPGDFHKHAVDAEMSNYDEFRLVYGALEELATAGVPVLYLTGDVHWGRVACGDDRTLGRPAMLYEVISSPSRLIDDPTSDPFKKAAAGIKGLFGHRDPWPRHSASGPVPDYFGERFALRRLFPDKGACLGDHVAMVTFWSAGSGVDFEVRYYPIHEDPAIAKSMTGGRYSLRVA